MRTTSGVGPAGAADADGWAQALRNSKSKTAKHNRFKSFLQKWKNRSILP
jgi:hypothetical protein